MNLQNSLKPRLSQKAIARKGSERMIAVLSHSHSTCAEDEEQLAGLGYDQELYRGFSPLAAFSFCFTCVSVIPSLSQGLINAIAIGGPAETIWAWLVGSFFSILTGLAMAELASAYPHAGSVYYWTGQLAPAGISNKVAYITGWCNWFGNAAGDAAFAAGFATAVNYCVQIKNQDSGLSVGATVVIAIAIHFVWSVLNLLRTDIQGKLNNIGAFIQIFGTFAIIIVLLATAKEYAPAKFVFTQGYDCTGYGVAAADISESGCTTTVAGYTIVLGLQSVVYAFVGYDGGSQIAEETQDASRAAAYGVIGTVVCCFVVGTVYLLAFLFATPDITAFVANGEDPFIGTFVATAGQGGGLGMMILLVFMFFFAGLGATGATVRITFALARDGALPFHRLLEQVWDVSFVPRNSVICIFFIESLLLLLPLVNETALTSITSTCCFAYTISYVIPMILRCTSGRTIFKPDKFSLGAFSIPCHFVAALFQTFSCAVLLFPTKYPVDQTNMNWTCVVMSCLVVCALIFWVIEGRHGYEGPKRQETSILKQKSIVSIKSSTSLPVEPSTSSIGNPSLDDETLAL